MILATKSWCPNCKVFVESMNAGPLMKTLMMRFVDYHAPDAEGALWHFGTIGLWPRVLFYSPAGERIEPPVSEPSVIGARPAAAAAPEPDDEPPVKCAVFQGLRAGGQGKSNDGPPWANSCVASLPVRIAPASCRRVTQVASLSGTRSIQVREWPLVSTPAVS